MLLRRCFRHFQECFPTSSKQKFSSGVHRKRAQQRCKGCSEPNPESKEPHQRIRTCRDGPKTSRKQEHFPRNAADQVGYDRQQIIRCIEENLKQSLWRLSNHLNFSVATIRKCLKAGGYKNYGTHIVQIMELILNYCFMESAPASSKFLAHLCMSVFFGAVLCFPYLALDRSFASLLGSFFLCTPEDNFCFDGVGKQSWKCRRQRQSSNHFRV